MGENSFVSYTFPLKEYFCHNEATIRWLEVRLLYLNIGISSDNIPVFVTVYHISSF